MGSAVSISFRGDFKAFIPAPLSKAQCGCHPSQSPVPDEQGMSLGAGRAHPHPGTQAIPLGPLVAEAPAVASPSYSVATLQTKRPRESTYDVRPGGLQC